MPTDVRVTIYDTALDALFLPGGSTWDWMERVGREHLGMALIEAPSRTGHLRQSHNLALTPYQKRGVRYSVGNYADYAYFVHEGTTGPITSAGWDDGHPAWLAIRPAPHSHFPTRTFVRSVSGQTANPWISNAAAIVLGKYGYNGTGYPG